MPTLFYNKEILQRQLVPLHDALRIAFGLSCCERMLPNYTAFKEEVKWGNEQPLRKALDKIWRHIESIETLGESAASQLNDECQKATPDADDFSVLLVGPAQDACMAICCVLDYISQKNLERIAQASSFAIDTIDGYVQVADKMIPSGFGAIPNSLDREERIRLHPLMQHELERQDADLKLLKSGLSIESLKARWYAPAKSNIGL